MKRSPHSSKAARPQYALGLDFGTLSCRALILDLRDGREVGSAVREFPHGVLDETLPGSRKPLPPETALQHPSDYLACLEQSVLEVLKDTGVEPELIVGLGVDFTASTVLPTDHEGTPLCLKKAWKNHPEAWVKLWKHHSAQPEADCINDCGARRKEVFLPTYGGRHSSEWMFAKLLETLNNAPEVFAAAERYLEAGDWVVWQLTGHETRCASAAGFKGLRVRPGRRPEDQQKAWQYPLPSFFKSLHPSMEKVIEEKIDAPITRLGESAGGLTEAWAARLGLLPGTPVASAIIDAHAAVPACGVTRPGSLMMIMGTSTCHLMLDDARHEVEGMCGVVQDGVIPGYWGYEAGQAGVGDVLAWFVEHGVPSSVETAASKAGISVWDHLARGAEQLKPGQSGLLALDWWNGNRSVLVDAELSGLIVGLTLGTRAEAIFRALMEATAFGTRRIIEAFTEKEIPIRRLVACGGLAKKNPVMMQIYADITGRPIEVVSSEQTSAMGAAMHGAVAAGVFKDLHAAARKLVSPPERTYKPNRAHRSIYDALYAEYLKLHDLFGRDPGSTMKALKRLRKPR